MGNNMDGVCSLTCSINKFDHTIEQINLLTYECQ